jgi:hypothetical protein
MANSDYHYQKFILDDESILFIVFTLDNNIDDEDDAETYYGYSSYECYDKDDNRYIYLVNDVTGTGHRYLKNKDGIKRIKKIYLEDKLIYKR